MVAGLVTEIGFHRVGKKEWQNRTVYHVSIACSVSRALIFNKMDKSLY